MTPPETIHATSIVLGTHGVLIRGRAGAGKTSLALHLLERLHPDLFTALIGDDRTALGTGNGLLVAHAVDTIRGLAEIRGLGIASVKRRAPAAVVALAVDLVPAEEVIRLPGGDNLNTRIRGVHIPALKLPQAPEGSLEANANAVLAALGLAGIRLWTGQAAGL